MSMPLGSIAVDGVKTSVLSGAGLSSFVGLSNPLSAGLSVLSALGGLGGGTKISAARAESQSGLGVFAPKNRVYDNKPIVDFGEPLQVAAVAVVAVIAIYLFKKVT